MSLDYKVQGADVAFFRNGRIVFTIDRNVLFKILGDFLQWVDSNPSERAKSFSAGTITGHFMKLGMDWQVVIKNRSGNFSILKHDAKKILGK